MATTVQKGARARVRSPVPPSGQHVFSPLCSLCTHTDIPRHMATYPATDTWPHKHIHPRTRSHIVSHVHSALWAQTCTYPDLQSPRSRAHRYITESHSLCTHTLQDCLQESLCLQTSLRRGKGGKRPLVSLLPLGSSSLTFRGLRGEGCHSPSDVAQALTRVACGGMGSVLEEAICLSGKSRLE